MNKSAPKIAIIGGGIAGSTAAIYLANKHLDVTLIERGPSLVNGPPICHLHAGGNLYREIDTPQCITLLRQSIDTLKLYPQCADYRPTVIAIPKRDPGTFSDLAPRLNKLQQQYENLVAKDSTNQVLGDPKDYYQTFDRQTVEQLINLPTPSKPLSAQDWLIPVVKSLDLSQLKFPLVLVQEFGLNVFRLGATATLRTEQDNYCTVLTNTQVSQIRKSRGNWQITLDSNNESEVREFDYIINACGYKSGVIDDLINCPSNRLVEFKAAYVAQWNQVEGQWPEVIFYGERGTPNGMAQLTPYPSGYFQIHGMTNDITLFNDGLVNSSEHSAQPRLPDSLANKITHQWPAEVATTRTQRAISFMSHFIPSFCSANVGGKPLFGAQQIPGTDPDLRAADVDFPQENYARSEIVKASSAIDAAQLIYQNINQQFSLALTTEIPLSTIMFQPNEQAITTTAQQLAIERGYPVALADRVHE